MVVAEVRRTLPVADYLVLTMKIGLLSFCMFQSFQPQKSNKVDNSVKQHKGVFLSSETHMVLSKSPNGALNCVLTLLFGCNFAISWPVPSFSLIEMPRNCAVFFCVCQENMLSTKSLFLIHFWFIFVDLPWLSKAAHPLSLRIFEKFERVRHR